MLENAIIQGRLFNENMRHNSDASLSQKEMSKILTELGLDTYQHASALSEKEWYFCRPENKKR